MTELLTLQEQFQGFILEGQSSITQSIVETDKVTVATRLGIYRDAYKLRLLESLTTSFPALYAYLGTDAFAQLISAYVDAHPSDFRSIRWYGDALPAFIKQYYQESNGYLAELAEFEWKMTLAFDAADDARVQIEDMTTVPPEAWAGLQFIPHQSLQRMNYNRFCQ